MAKGFNKSDVFTQVASSSSKINYTTKSIQIFATKSSLPVLINNINSPIIPLHQKTAHAVDMSSQAGKISLLGISKVPVQASTENILFLTGRLFSLAASTIGITLNSVGLYQQFSKLCCKPVSYQDHRSTNDRIFRITQHALHITINSFLFKTFFEPEEWLYPTNFILMGIASTFDFGYGISHSLYYNHQKELLRPYLNPSDNIKPVIDLSQQLTDHYQSLSRQHIASSVSNGLVMLGAFLNP